MPGHEPDTMPERAMTKLLYDIEDYLEDAAKTPHMPGWMRRIVRSVGRTVGEAGDMVALRYARF
jgi:hypothetical protein